MYKILSINVNAIVLFLSVVVTVKPIQLDLVSIISSSAIEKNHAQAAASAYRTSFYPFHFSWSFIPLHSPKRSHFRCAPPLFRFPVKSRPHSEQSNTNLYVTCSLVRPKVDVVGTTAVRRFVFASTTTWYFIGVLSGQTDVSARSRYELWRNEKKNERYRLNGTALMGFGTNSVGIMYLIIKFP